MGSGRCIEIWQLFLVTYKGPLYSDSDLGAVRMRAEEPDSPDERRCGNDGVLFDTAPWRAKPIAPIFGGFAPLRPRRP
jgi:hypothetical protein